MRQAGMGPPAAERARTILSRATSADIGWLDREPEPSLESVAARRLNLRRTLGSGSTRLVTVEIAEAAPLPVRDRILTRLHLSGHVQTHPEGSAVLDIVPVVVSMEEGGVAIPITLSEFLLAEPDPLAGCEGVLLSHLDAAHPYFVATLTSLVDPWRRQGVVRVWPLRLDRHGIVLRLEYARGHHDVRLSFPAAARTPDEVRVQLRALVSEATRRRQRCRSRRVTWD